MTRTNFKFKDSVFCAIKGMFASISSERNIKIQMLLGTVLIFLSLLLDISKTYFITIIIMCFLVVILEMFNRGFEMLIDFVSPEYNKNAGKIKDTMAGVVLLTFIMSVIVSFLVLYSPIINLIKILSQNYLFVLCLISVILILLIYILTYRIKEENLKLKNNN